MSRTIISPITKIKLSKAFFSLCSQRSIPIRLLRYETAPLDEIKKKYIPIQNSNMYNSPGSIIHFHKRCLLMNLWALKYDSIAITISLSKWHYIFEFINLLH